MIALRTVTARPYLCPADKQNCWLIAKSPCRLPTLKGIYKIAPNITGEVNPITNKWLLDFGLIERRADRVIDDRSDRCCHEKEKAGDPCELPAVKFIRLIAGAFCCRFCRGIHRDDPLWFR
jgi:hypothetical protein